MTKAIVIAALRMMTMRRRLPEPQRLQTRPSAPPMSKMPPAPQC